MKFKLVSLLARLNGRQCTQKSMRLLGIIVLLTCALQLQAFAQQRISIQKVNVPVEEVLLEIRKQTGTDFFYDKAELAKAGRVSISVTNATLKVALDALVKGKSLSYQIKDGIVTITTSSFPRTVFFEGVVMDEKGQKLSGVNVEAFGGGHHAIGSRTDALGRFRISVVSLNDTLQFSSVGYERKREPIAGRNTVYVTLLESIQELDDVVITGIYERKAESFTGSSLTISKEDIRKVGNGNIFQSLRNISPSLFLDNFEMGSNPNTMPQLQVRGAGSLPILDDGLTAGLKGNYLRDPTQPLFILDGFEANVDRIFDLDINRIETVTILKDAASKAIYGSKGANGVIVIETSKMVSDKPMVTYNTSVNIELPDLTSYNLTNALQKLEAERIDGMYTTSPVGYDPAEEQLSLDRLYNHRRKLVLEGLDTYWLAKPLQDGVGQRHNLSIELGNRDLRVITDFNYFDVTGAMKGSGRTNIGGNVNASYRLKNFLFRNITSLNTNKSSDSPYGTFDEYVRMNPYWRAENLDGSIPYYAEQVPNADSTYYTTYPNPLYNSTLGSVLDQSYLNFTNNFYLEWTIIPGLRTVARAGVDLKRSDADEFYPALHTRFDSYLAADVARKGSYQVNNGKSAYLSGDLNINYSKEVNKNYYFANIGYNISERTFSELVHYAEGFPSDRLQNIIFARSYALDSRPAGIDGVTRDMGFLGAFSYMWDNRFLSDFTYRTNASSQFGADRRWASFWSFGLGWNLHNEAWFKNTGWVDQLRIRGSLGATGNQNFNTNASIATYQYALESFYQGFPGSQLMNMVNPGLQWESAFDYNGGLDAKIGRFGLRFDYYQRFTENLLADITIPASTGFDMVKDNLGKIKNSGVEAYANYAVWQQGRNFFSINASIETNESRIIELSESMRAYNERMDAIAADQGNNRPIQKFVDGMSLDAIWAVPSLGIDPATGNEIYVDRDGNTTFEWDANDMVVAGVARPKYQGVIGFSAEYKGIGLSVNARYLGGGQLYNQTLVDRVENVDMDYNVDERVLTGRWLYPGQNALFKRLGNYYMPNENGTVTPTQELTRLTTRFVQDRRELHIATVNLYYDFYDLDWLKRSRLQRLRLAFNMNELATISSITIERGTSYPFARTLSFSLSATF